MRDNRLVLDEIYTSLLNDINPGAVDEITQDTTFVDDLGADSLDLMRILILMQEKFGVALVKNSIYRMDRVSDCLELIKEVKSN